MSGQGLICLNHSVLHERLSVCRHIFLGFPPGGLAELHTSETLGPRRQQGPNRRSMVLLSRWATKPLLSLAEVACIALLPRI